MTFETILPALIETDFEPTSEANHRRQSQQGAPPGDRTEKAGVRPRLHP